MSDFNGVSLSTITSSTMTVNPDMPEAHQLRGWYWTNVVVFIPSPLSRYDNYGREQQVQSLSGQMGGGGGYTPYLSLSQVKELSLGQKEKGDYFNCYGSISFIRKENIVYKVILLLPHPYCHDNRPVPVPSAIRR